MIDPKTKITPNLSFGEVTDSTRHPHLVAENRRRAEPLFASAGVPLCQLGQHAFDIVKAAYPGRVRFLRSISGFRYGGPGGLNEAAGGADTSQHLFFEALDLQFVGVGVKDANEALLAAAREGRIKFGQLLAEYGKRASEDDDDWIHISLGRGWRDLTKCGQIGTKPMGGKVTITDRISAAV